MEAWLHQLSTRDSSGRDVDPERDALLSEVTKFLHANWKHVICHPISGEPVVPIEFKGIPFGSRARTELAPPTAVSRTLLSLGDNDLLGLLGIAAETTEVDATDLRWRLDELLRTVNAWRRFLLFNPTYIPPAGSCNYEDCLDLWDKICKIVDPYTYTPSVSWTAKRMVRRRPGAPEVFAKRSQWEAYKTRIRRTIECYSFADLWYEGAGVALAAGAGAKRQRPCTR
eukprot:tig00020509_g9751.t1